MLTSKIAVLIYFIDFWPELIVYVIDHAIWDNTVIVTTCVEFVQFVGFIWVLFSNYFKYLLA